MADVYVQYDPDKVIILVGTHRVRAFGDNQMVVVAFTNPRRGIKEGVDGEARHVEYKSKTGTVTIPLQEFSPSNEVFQLAHEGKLILPITIKDLTSKASLFVTASAMVQTDPDFERAKDPTDNTWVFQFTHGKKIQTGAKTASL